MRPNPFLEELEALAESEDPHDEKQFQRMIFRSMIYVVDRLDQIAATTNRLSEEGQITREELEEVKQLTDQVEDNTDRIETLERIATVNPSVLTIVRRHPLAFIAAVFLALALLVWFLSLPPAAIQDFFGIVA